MTNLENKIIKTRQTLKDSVSGIFRNPDTNRLFINNRCIRSVTQVISKYCPFDADAVAKWVSEKPEHPLYGKTVEDIKAVWHDKAVAAGREGRQAHVVASQLFKKSTGEPIQVNVATPKEHGIEAFWKESLKRGYTPVASEQIIFNRQLYYAGIFDLLMLNTEEMTFELFDFKTTEDFHKSFGKCMSAPMDFLRADNVGKATFQLNLYMMQLANIGIDVDRMSVVWAKDDGDFEIIPIEFWPDEIHHALTQKVDKSFYIK